MNFGTNKMKMDEEKIPMGQEEAHRWPLMKMVDVGKIFEEGNKEVGEVAPTRAQPDVASRLKPHLLLNPQNPEVISQ
jgi:hypothetical protein